MNLSAHQEIVPATGSRRGQPTREAAGTGRRAGVTILELMVAVSLISFIILALYQMFDRTQTQMRRAVREVDKFEGGRAAAEIIKRDLAQMTAGNSAAGTLAANYYVSTNWSASAFGLTNNGTNVLQLNVLNDLHFTAFDPAATPNNWSLVSYRVASSTNPLVPTAYGLGTLYRWSTNANRFSTALQLRLYNQLPPTNYWQRVVDNVVHFRVTGITNGVPVGVTNVNLPAATIAATLTNTDLPSHIEIELGYADSRIAERSRALLPNNAGVQAALGTNAEAIHMFRLQIPIRAGLQ